MNQRLDHVIERVRSAADSAGVATPQIMLAVKTQTVDTCRLAAQMLSDHGMPVLLGHNHVQEAQASVAAIRQVPDAQIHLIGPLQTNKINHALACCDVIETLDSVKGAQAIDKRVRSTTPVPVMVEVNTSGETSKHGCTPEEAQAVVEAVELSDNLALAGFMTVGLNSEDEKAVRASYAQLRDIRDLVAARLCVPELDLALSMGMTHDLEWATREGATMVRVGTAVFGQRTTHSA